MSVFGSQNSFLISPSQKDYSRLSYEMTNYAGQKTESHDGTPEVAIPKMSQEALAEMVGTTRSRVSFFMNRFRKLGFIRYNGALEVHNSLLNIVLHD